MAARWGLSRWMEVGQQRSIIGFSLRVLVFFASLLLFWAGIPAIARHGGGHAHSGGGGHSSGGGHGMGGHFGSGGSSFGASSPYAATGGLDVPLFLTLLAILVVCVIGYAIYQNSQRGPNEAVLDANSRGPTSLFQDGQPLTDYVSTAAVSPLAVSSLAAVQQNLQKLQRYDPNFSEIAFTDFIYTLYGRAHEARGQGTLSDLSPYLSPAVISHLTPAPPAIRSVHDVVIGSAAIVAVSDPDLSPDVQLTVRYEANYTETDASSHPTGYYVVEEWVFSRRRDVLSLIPEEIAALHCPRCGGALDTRADGACAHCGVKVTGGDFHWFVTSAQTHEREARGPLLTTEVPETGTDLPNVYAPDLAAARQQFLAANPHFSEERTEERFETIFRAAQDAWSSMQWEKARPYETDNMFHMNQYWIEAYRRQNLRNALDEVHVEGMTLVKVRSDAFYDALTMRIFADMKDYTIDGQGHVVCGSPNQKRRFSEYWTFIRRRDAKENTRPDTHCPNCGAPLKINMAGTCDYCGGKITSGHFDWVLSRIEQDESYVG